MTDTQVPFVDLRPSHRPLKDDFLAGLGELVDSGAFINGPAVERFENAFAAYCGVAECVGVSSGLDALRLGLQAAGIGPGDEVIAPAHTFIATVAAISQAGATPVLVDVDAEDANIDPDAAAAAVTPRTRAIMAVHLYGQLADVRRLVDVASTHEVELHEDAAQAHGAERDGIRAGQSGRAAAFSFYPGKNLGALGDAGAVVTADAELADNLRALREHGQRRKYEHDAIGWTARLDTIQAHALERKLRELDDWNDQRRAVARFYSEALEGIGDLRLPTVKDHSDPVWHLYALRTGDPGALADHLRGAGIATGHHYPVPIHLTSAFAHLGLTRGAFPAAEDWAAHEISLPIFPGLTEEQAHAVVDGVRGYFARRPAA